MTCPRCGSDEYTTHKEDKTHPENTTYRCPKCGGVIHHRSRKPHNRRNAKTARRKTQWITHRCSNQPPFFKLDSFIN